MTATTSQIGSALLSISASRADSPYRNATPISAARRIAPGSHAALTHFGSRFTALASVMKRGEYQFGQRNGPGTCCGQAGGGCSRVEHRWGCRSKTLEE